VRPWHRHQSLQGNSEVTARSLALESARMLIQLQPKASSTGQCEATTGNRGRSYYSSSLWHWKKLWLVVAGEPQSPQNLQII
jgi:hypothetical protein